MLLNFKNSSYDSYETPEEDYGVINNSNCKKIMIALIIVIVLMGLTNILTNNWEYLFFYYFGLVFFLAGFHVGTSNPFGVIFLFSHGGSGLGLMTVPTIKYVLSNPIVTENPSRAHMYLGVIGVIILIAVVKSILVSCKYGFSQKALINEQFFNKDKAVVLLLFTTAIVLIQIFPFAINYLIKM